MGYSSYNRGGSGGRSSSNRRDYDSPPRRSHQSSSPAASGSASGSLSSRFRQVEEERRRAPPAVNRPGSSSANPRQQQQSNNNRQRMPFSERNLSQPQTGRARGGDKSRGGRSGAATGGAIRKPKGKGGRGSMMEIDQVATGRPVGRFPMTTDGKRGGKKRGGTGMAGVTSTAPRGSGRGGRRGGRGGAGRGGVPLSREKLDADLDSYMLSDVKTAKTTLDADLESYMLGTSDIPQQIGA